MDYEKSIIELLKNLDEEQLKLIYEIAVRL